MAFGRIALSLKYSYRKFQKLAIGTHTDNYEMII